MLKGNVDGFAWKSAGPEDRKTVCHELAEKLGRDEDFLVQALGRLYDSDDPKTLGTSIEEMARISVAAMHLGG